MNSSWSAPSSDEQGKTTQRKKWPLLLVIGSADRNASSKDYIVDKAPAHTESRFVTVSADHFSVPTAAIEEHWITDAATRKSRDAPLVRHRARGDRGAR